MQKILIKSILALLLTATPELAQQQQQQPAPPATPKTGNDFPGEDTNVPVLPNAAGDVPATAAQPKTGEDRDPIHAPDAPWSGPRATDNGGAPPADANSSSSLAGMADLLPKDDDKPDKKNVIAQKTPEQAFKEDMEVGSYYMDRKNWKGALARFQHAFVLNNEDPDTIFQMAEAEHHLNLFADAKKHYELLLTDDPDGPHSKAARKALEDPALSSADTKPVAAKP